MPESAYKDWLAGEILYFRKVRDVQAAKYKINLERVYRNKDLKSLPRPVLIPAITADAFMAALAKLESIEQGERDGSQAGRENGKAEDGGDGDE